VGFLNSEHPRDHCTFKLIVCDRVTPPPLAVTVIVEVPTPALAAAFTVNVLLPLPGDAIVTGANVPVTFLGNPLTDSATLDANPLLPAIDKVSGNDPPRDSTRVVPLTVSANVGPITVSPKDCVFVTPPPDAVTINE